MHELGYTRDIIDTVLDASTKAGAHEVRTVYLTIGEVRDIVDDLFRKCFAHFARGTIAENAKIEINHVPFTVRCDKCGAIYHIELYDESSTECPLCGENQYKLHSGMEFQIDRVEIV